MRCFQVDIRTDVFAFGCVLYEMVSGNQPFSGTSVHDTLHRIGHEEPTPLIEIDTSLPAELQRILSKTLAKDPAERYQHADDLIVDLRALGSQVEARTVAPVGSGSALSDRRGATGDRVRDSDSLGRSSAPRGWGLVASAAVLAGTLGAIAAWSVTRPPDPPVGRVARARIDIPVRIDRTGFAQRPLAISPDGRRVVLGLMEQGRVQLYLREMGALEVTPIPGTEGGNTPIFSPDGESIAFFTAGLLKRVELGGGLPVTVCATPGVHYGGVWSQTGEIIFNNNLTRNLLRVDADGGEPVEIELRGAEAADSLQWPRFLPGEETLVVSVVSSVSGGVSQEIGVADLNTLELKVLRRGTDARYVPTGHLVWSDGGVVLAAPFDLERQEISGTPVSLSIDASITAGGALLLDVSDDGTLVYVSGSDGGQSRLVWVERDGRISPITDLSSQYSQPLLSPDGQRLAFTMPVAPGAPEDIYVYDLERGNAQRLTREGLNTYAVWSPNGDTLTFSSNRAGVFDLYRRSSDFQGEAEILLAGEGASVPRSFSPDGSTLLYYDVNPVSQRDIWVLSDGEDPRLLLGTPFNERGPVFSPDGNWFAYVSDEDGSDEIYVRSYPDAGAARKISTAGGTEPLWSPDGTELFYRLGNSVISVPLETALAFRAGQPTELFTGAFAPDGFGNHNYDVTADGERFVMVLQETSLTERVYIVLNWFEELKQRVPTGGSQ